MYLEKIIHRLSDYWNCLGCANLQPYDLPVGAATFHPATLLRAVGRSPWRCTYVQGCRRPTDSRYGKNPNRLQYYYQFQTVLKPPPTDIQNLFIGSLETLDIPCDTMDIRFVEDNWASPTLGATGLGWEIWLNGMEICQYTYFQQVGGIECNPPLCELAYGLERIALALQNKSNVFDLAWSKHLSYRDIFLANEEEYSHFNLEEANTQQLADSFNAYEHTCKQLIAKKLAIPAYEQVILASHAFNLLDARNAISTVQRQAYILRTRKMTKEAVKTYLEKHTDKREKT